MTPLPKTAEAPVSRCVTLGFHREVAAPLAVLWQAWTAPSARALWSSPAPEVEIEVLEAETRIGGREVTLCKVAGQPDTRCEAIWLHLHPGLSSVNTEVISSEGATQSAALVTADFAGTGDRSRIAVTVQLSSLARDMAADYREGFDPGLDNMVGVAERTMLIERVIPAPRALVWETWMNPETLPLWWGPEGFSCRTTRIDLRAGGEWLFDMIGPDGTVYPNHHRYGEMQTGDRLTLTLLRGEHGPRHADAWITFEDQGGGTRVTLCMAMQTVDEFRVAKSFGAEALGQQTLAKLERAVLGR